MTMRSKIGVAALVVAASCASIVGMSQNGAVRAAPAPSTITGIVFQDFDSDGVLDTTVAIGVAVDVGVAGIEVRAFDSTGAQVGSTTTGVGGTYTLTITGAATTAVRVEFTIPSSNATLAAFRPSFATTTGASDSTRGTAIQFATVGDSSVNFAVNVPGEFCQNNPNLAISRQCMNSATAPSIWVSNYNGGPYKTGNGYLNLYTDWAATQAALAGTTGSVHGVAWDVRSGRVLTAAYVRSFVPLYESPIGTPRPGAIFTTTPTGTKAAQGTGGTTSFLVDLETLMPGDQFSNSTAPGAGVANAGFTGYIPSNASRNLPFGPDADINATYDGVYEEVGKAGIGDIDTDGQGNLYVVSLYTRQLYKVTLPANGSAPTQMSSVGSIVQNITCTNGQARTFGVTEWRANLYMGVVCDGSQDYNNASPNSDRDERNVTYTIVTYSPTTQQWTTFLGPFPLYATAVGGNFKGSPVMTFPDNSGGINHNSWRWNPWTDQFNLLWRTNGGLAWGPIYPQPMPSDLQFDRDGSVIVSMRDRTGDRQTQYVVGSRYPDGTLRDNTGEISAGDMYRICRTGSGFSAADYVWEGATGCEQSFDNFNFNNGGLGVAREYYRDDYGKSDQYHGDQSAGMLEYVPGFPEVINTAMDPNIGWNGTAWDLSGATFSSGGISYYLNSTGNRQTAVNSGGGVILHGAPLTSLNMADGSFGKVVGMGDVEALCDLAPVQIGDRVWVDSDGDGVQDPGEAPIAGATVRLYDAAGNVVATTTTNANGEYSFSSTSSGLTTGADYTIRFDNPADFAPGGPLAGYALTTADTTTPVATDTDNSIDSDATNVAGFPRISVPALSPGGNDHTFDAGFVPVVAVGNYTWVDVNANGVQDAGEVPLAGVTVELLDTNGNPAVDANGLPVAAQTTDANGKYLFDNLAPGNYRMKFTPPAGYAGTSVDAAAATQATDSDANATTGMTDIFSIAPRITGDTVADTDASTIARLVNPTIDAGFVPKVSVGSKVWVDTNRDGVQDSGEPGIAGVTLTITKADGSPVTDVFGNPVTTTTTDANGNYVFENLPVGQYKVLVTDPAGYVPTVTGKGTTSTDSSTGSATSANLSSNGASETTLGFGFVLPMVSVGDLVWVDTNRDGVQDPGESGIPNVTLSITKADGSPVTDVFGNAVTTTTTDANGKYSFDDLPVGQYKVSVVDPAGYIPTVTGKGTASTDSSTGSATSANLSSNGASDTTLDFGFVLPMVSVGDLVWVDANRDGVQDPGEPGIAGVTLTMIKADGGAVTDVFGNAVTTTTTDANGNYSFENLPVGQYKVLVTDPAGYVPTVTGKGTTATDSSTGSATSANLSSNGASDTALDFGFMTVPLPPKVPDQEVVASPGQAVDIDPFKNATPSEGAEFIPQATRVWDSAKSTWSTDAVTDDGSWSVLFDKVRFVPNPDFVGTAAITVRVRDTNGFVAKARLGVKVRGLLPATGSDPAEPAAFALRLLLVGLALLLTRRQQPSGSTFR